MTNFGYKSMSVTNPNGVNIIQEKLNIKFTIWACVLDKQSYFTFVADVIIILTATNAQFLPLQVGVVLASTKIITNFLHIVQQQIGSIISLGSWSLV